MMGKYQVKFTLCRLAAIAISKHLWKYSDLKDDLKSCIDVGQAEEKMTSAVIFVMDQFLVPKAAKEELMFAVGSMGGEMWQLIIDLEVEAGHMIPEDSLFALKASAYVDYVCWTTDGCLNAPETIRSLYFAGIFQESYATLEKLCTYCLEDCIDDLTSKISMDGYSDWRSRQWNTRSDSEFKGILGAYLIARVGDFTEHAVDVVFRELPDQFYDNSYSLNENMFMNSLVNRKYWAAKYFWGSLNENQRMRTLVEICERIVSNDPTTQKYKDLFVTKGGLNDHSLIFFLQQISNYGLDDMRIRVLGSAFVLLELLKWPYDNLFLETLKESLIHHDFIDYGPIILHIFKNINVCQELQFIDRDVKYHRIFWRIWEMNPQNLKDSINYPKFLMKLVRSGEVNLLRYILKDRELNHRREEFLKEIVKFYLGVEEHEDFLKDFMMSALSSDEERDWFRHQIVSTVYNENDETDSEEFI